MGFVFIPVYLNLLGVEAYAVIAIFALIQGWLTLLDFGMTPTLNREMARFKAGEHDAQTIHNLLRSLEIIAVAISAAVLIVLFLVSDWLSREWFKTVNLSASTLADALTILAFVVALRFVEGIYHGALYGLHQQVWFGVVSATMAMARGVGAVVVLFFISQSLNAFFFWQIVFSLASLFLYRRKVMSSLPKPPEPPNFSLVDLKRIWRFAGAMSGIALLSMLLTQVDKLLLSKLVTLEAFGYYSLAATLAATLYMLVVPVNNVVYPLMVRYLVQRDQSGLIALYHRSAQFVTAATASVMLTFVFFANDVVYAWSGNPALAVQVGTLLSVLSVGTFLNCLMHMPYQLQLASNATHIAIRTNIGSLFIVIPVIAYAVPIYGAMAAAWTWVGLNAVYFVVVIYLTHRTIIPTEKRRWYFEDVAMPFLGAFVCVFAANQLFASVSGNRLVSVLFFCITVVTAFLCAVLLSSQINLKSLFKRGANA